MAKTFSRVFKCRNCGQIIVSEARLQHSVEWMLNDIFENINDYVSIGQSSTISQPASMFHRCDPENLGICDFIGWRTGNDANL